LPIDVEASFGLAPGVNPVFPPHNAFEVDVATPDGRTLPVQSAELAAELERRSGDAVMLRFSERSLYDCRPISVFGNASVRGLGDEMVGPEEDASAVLLQARAMCVLQGQAVNLQQEIAA
jgi:uncharacterized protein